MHALLDLREPVSALLHGLGLVAAVPGTWWLWRRAAGGGRARWSALLVYGSSLVGCLGASALYHGAALGPDGISILRRADHIGIHFLIAGTYTPIAGVFLRGRLRAATLSLTWTVAAAGTAVLLLWGLLPAWLFTMIYLLAGWGALFAYRAIVREHTWHVARPILLGGVVYSVGAVVNLAGWPVLISGLFEAHELFHLFVLAGAALHYRFILRVVASHGIEPGPPAQGRADRPHTVRPHAPLGTRRAARSRS